MGSLCVLSGWVGWYMHGCGGGASPKELQTTTITPSIPAGALVIGRVANDGALPELLLHATLGSCTIMVLDVLRREVPSDFIP